jgi:hypothetical protein
MRTISILLALCAACDDEPTAQPQAAEAPETPVGVAPPEAEGTAEPEAAEETTTGFIEATVDGERKRFEYLPAHENQVLTRVTHMQAHPSADAEEKLEITLLGWDVRQVELPMFFKFGMRGANGRVSLAAAGRMPGLRYEDAEGNVYNRLVNDDTLECQSLEDLVLSCTFSGTFEAEEGEETVELTEGRAEVRLVTNEMADRFVDGTVGMAADESVERVQEAIDRRGN